jgi:hypothetical protein
LSTSREGKPSPRTIGAERPGARSASDLRRKAILAFVVSLLLVGGLTTALLLWNRAADRAKTAHTAAGPEKVEKRADVPQDPKTEKKAAAPGPDGGPPLLSGKVVDLKGSPIPKAHVHVEPPSKKHSDALERVTDRIEREEERAAGVKVKGMGTIAKAVTGADGTYNLWPSDFKVPPQPGEYRVEASANGYGSIKKEWTHTGEPTVIDFRLGHPGATETIEGTVVDEAGNPIRKAKVLAEQEDGHPKKEPKVKRSTAVDQDSTNKKGRFLLNVPPGTFVLEAQKKRFITATVPGVQAGARKVVIKLKGSRSITGVVLD